jgi:hypothetical protein
MTETALHKFRTYTFELERPLPTTNPDCRVFQDYVRDQITGPRKLLKFDPIKDGNYCLLQIKFQSYSHGKKSPNRLRKKIENRFPDCRIKQLRRHRKSDTYGSQD